MTTRTCALPSCGRTFEAERADARYCSPSCRGRASRERRRQASPAPPSLSQPEPQPSELNDDFTARVLSLEERLENLEADLDLAEARQSTLNSMTSRLEAFSRRLPGESQVQEWSRAVVREEADAVHERIDDLERAVGLDKDASDGSLICRVASLETTEPGSDQVARTRIRRLEDRLAREVHRGNALEQQVAVLAAGLRDLAGVVETGLGR
ncbi:MAG: hypothetical protein ABIO70_27515 [Pseudomonadota bacterium]